MMKRLLYLILILCAFSGAAHAQCSGSGITWSCAAGSTQAQVQTALNAASNGATLTFANGAYTWTSGHIGFSNANGAALLCATVRGCIVTSSGNAVIGWAQFACGTNTQAYRISGFVFNDSSAGRTIWGPYAGSSGTTGSPCVYTNIRIDHNTFNLAAMGTAISFADQTSHFYAFGDIDDNILNAPQNAMLVDVITALISPTMPNALGTANNLFIETNTINITTMNNPGESCIDGVGSARFVVRFNVVTNCLWATHGVSQAGAGGPESIEFYGNTTVGNGGVTDPTFTPGYRMFHSQGNSLFMAFNNVFTPAAMPYSNSVIEMLNYRDYPNGVDGGLPPDAAQCDGTVNGPTDAPFVIDVNRSPIGTYRGYPCWRQPGRDPANQNIAPMFAWNNIFSTGGQVLLNVPDGGFGSPDYQTQHYQAGRDYYNAVSASANSSPTSPFNGSTGMGFGLLVNRPATGTANSENSFGHGVAGTGYFATDVGVLGTLYEWTGSSWVATYAPYPYPFVPGGGGTPIVTVSPTSFTWPIAIAVGGDSVIETITVANSSSATGNAVINLPFNTTDPSQFTITGNRCATVFGGTLTPGQNCGIDIQFSPLSATSPPTPLTASLPLTISGTLYTIPLAGSGTITVGVPPTPSLFAAVAH